MNSASLLCLPLFFCSVDGISDICLPLDPQSYDFIFKPIDSFCIILFSILVVLNLHLKLLDSSIGFIESVLKLLKSVRVCCGTVRVCCGTDRVILWLGGNTAATRASHVAYVAIVNFFGGLHVLFLLSLTVALFFVAIKDLV